MSRADRPADRIAALDGWRGIAILFVLVSHTLMFFAKNYPSWSLLGQHGVTIFFVLSGYLITGKLLEPALDLRRFYMRRFFRLTPVALAYLSLLACIGAIIHLQLVKPAEILACTLFYRNYTAGMGREFTLHFWSLSIEEQFYLIWPALLLLSGRWARWVAIGCAAAGSAWAVTHAAFYVDFNAKRTEVRFGGLLVGCALALFLQSARAKARFIEFAKWAAVPCLVVIVYFIRRDDAVPSLIECAGWGILIVGTSLAGLRAPGPLAWLGRISYSVYVWHWLSLYLLPNFPPALLLPVASYYFIEKPAAEVGRLLVERRWSYGVQSTS